MSPRFLPRRLCTGVALIATLAATANSTDPASAANAVSLKSQSSDRSALVTEWFNKYDQIRRDAEMTMGDKLQSCMLTASKPDKNNAALALRMTSKYSTALSALKQLKQLPETKELQLGYIQYFSKARQLFADYLVAQKSVPFSNQSLVPAKKKMEALDKANKLIDASLRKRYRVNKHKHS